MEVPQEYHIRLIAELQALVLELRENHEVNIIVLADYRSALLALTEHLQLNFNPLFKNCDALDRAVQALRTKHVRI